MTTLRNKYNIGDKLKTRNHAGTDLVFEVTHIIVAEARNKILYSGRCLPCYMEEDVQLVSSPTPTAKATGIYVCDNREEAGERAKLIVKGYIEDGETATVSAGKFFAEIGLKTPELELKRKVEEMEKELTALRAFKSRVETAIEKK